MIKISKRDHFGLLPMESIVPIGGDDYYRTFNGQIYYFMVLGSLKNPRSVVVSKVNMKLHWDSTDKERSDFKYEEVHSLPFNK